MLATTNGNGHHNGRHLEDADVVTITISSATAEALLELAGLHPDRRGQFGGRFWDVNAATEAAITELAAAAALLTRLNLWRGLWRG